jgi:hypothetical protein
VELSNVKLARVHVKLARVHGANLIRQGYRPIYVEHVDALDVERIGRML